MHIQRNLWLPKITLILFSAMSVYDAETVTETGTGTGHGERMRRTMLRKQVRSKQSVFYVVFWLFSLICHSYSAHSLSLASSSSSLCFSIATEAELLDCDQFHRISSLEYIKRFDKHFEWHIHRLA